MFLTRQCRSIALDIYRASSESVNCTSSLETLKQIIVSYPLVCETKWMRAQVLTFPAGTDSGTLTSKWFEFVGRELQDPQCL